MLTSDSTTSQPVAVLSRYVLAHLLTGIVGYELFGKGLDIEVLTEIVFDIQEGIEAGLPKVDEAIIHKTIIELDTKNIDKED
jgi:hypothetical protein